MDIPRAPYFKKELTFMVSRSYGPGRYDSDYEEHGQDYPVGYVRWTENRNIEAFLDMVASGAVRPDLCTTHRFPISDAVSAFELILEGQEPYLGVVLEYPEDTASGKEAQSTRIEIPSADLNGTGAKSTGRVGLSFIGAGGFARGVHMPNAKKLPNVALRGIVDSSGMAAKSAGNKFGFAFCASAESELYDDPETDAVVIVTPHSQHADGVCRALAAGKSVLVEKPLSINVEGLRKIHKTLQSHPGNLLIGFNRRFAPLAVELKEHFAGRGPLNVQYRCNAGPLPADHWISDPSEGGRIIGEACHFLDFFTFLTDAAPVSVFAAAPSIDSADDAAITISYADGSVCQLVYSSTGPSSYSKERVEVFGGGMAGTLTDFRRLEINSDNKRFKPRKLMQADKGHSQELRAFVESVRHGGPSPISTESLFDTTLVSIAVLESIQRGTPISIAKMRKRVVSC